MNPEGITSHLYLIQHKYMNLIDVMYTFSEKDVLSGGSIAGTSSSWTGWAFSGMSSLTSKIYRGNPKGAAASKQQTQGINRHTIHT